MARGARQRRRHVRRHENTLRTRHVPWQRAAAALAVVNESVEAHASEFFRHRTVLYIAPIWLQAIFVYSLLCKIQLFNDAEGAKT